MSDYGEFIHEIRFDNATHSYWIGDKKLESVSSIVGKLVPPFDRDRISSMVAEKRNVSQAEILAEWEEARNKAVDKGELVHSYIENALDESGLFLFPPEIPECKAFDSAWAMLKEKKGAEIVHKEKIVGCPELQIAGRFDLMLSLSTPYSKTHHLFDWKTGKYKTSNRFENLLPPFDDLPNCEHSKASLQTSLYRILVERSGFPFLGESHIVHLASDGSHVIYKAIDLRKRLLAWLEAR